MTSTRDALLRMDHAALADELRAGYPIPWPELLGFAYRGVSLGLPSWLERATWKTFCKVFVDDPVRGPRGYNVRVQQRGLDAPSEPQRNRDGTPRSFGHYAVVDASSIMTAWGPTNGLLLDYGPGAGLLDPLRFVRDPLVSLREGSGELLLGCTYLALGLPVRTPVFFSLEREGPATEVPVPPRWPESWGARGA